ncbi:hypothetical protein ACLOJK_002445 [Asimina triloba]
MAPLSYIDGKANLLMPDPRPAADRKTLPPKKLMAAAEHGNQQQQLATEQVIIATSLCHAPPSTQISLQTVVGVNQMTVSDSIRV